jgi:hypothetical protein
MSERVIRMHRSASHEDMHERLRRLLYEAFFGVDFDGAAARSPHNERPRLVLMSSRKGAMRPEPRGRITRPSDTDVPGAPAAPVDGQPVERPAGVPLWTRPKLERLP